MLLSLPHVTETMQWGENLVYWAADKAIGGKMFAVMDLGARGSVVIAFAATAEHAAELCEQDGLRPAPYFARLHWVAAERWDALGEREWALELRTAYDIIFGKLPPRTLEALALPARERTALIAERRKLLAAKTKAAKGKSRAE